MVSPLTCLLYTSIRSRWSRSSFETSAASRLRKGLSISARTFQSATSFRFGEPLRFTARLMRDSVRSSPILHSHTRWTLQPSFRSFRETRASLRRLDTIFCFQNFVLLFDGRSQRGHPCQKHPSTNSATLDTGHAKSGFPATGHCFL